MDVQIEMCWLFTQRHLFLSPTDSRRHGGNTNPVMDTTFPSRNSNAKVKTKWAPVRHLLDLQWGSSTCLLINHQLQISLLPEQPLRSCTTTSNVSVVGSIPQCISSRNPLPDPEMRHSIQKADPVPVCLVTCFMCLNGIPKNHRRTVDVALWTFGVSPPFILRSVEIPFRAVFNPLPTRSTMFGAFRATGIASGGLLWCVIVSHSLLLPILYTPHSRILS